MNQGQTAREFVSGLVKMQSDLESAGVSRAYQQALTEYLKGEPAREAAAARAKYDLEYAKMNRQDLKDHIENLKWQLEESGLTERSAADIKHTKTRIKSAEQAMRFKEAEEKQKPTVEYEVGGVSYEAKVSPETAVEWGFKRRAEERAKGEVDLEKEKFAVTKSKAVLEAVLGKIYGAGGQEINIIMTGGKLKGSDAFQKLKDDMVDPDPWKSGFARYNMKQVLGAMLNLGSMTLPLDKTGKDKFKVGSTYNITDPGTGLRIEVERLPGNEYLTIKRIL